VHATKTKHELAQEARADLARLHRELIEAEERVVETHSAELLEANEQLAVSTLRAQGDAETIARGLKFDPLTELPNRVLLLDRLKQGITNAKRNDTRLALLFVDLNNFKQINDTLGHATGDKALKLAAHCLASTVRAEDTVSRHGGDEFLILLAKVSKATDALLVAEKVLAALGIPTQAGNEVIRLTASIGISVYPDDGEDAETLIDRADAAMYLAKKHGAGSFAVQSSRPPAASGPEPPALESTQPALPHCDDRRRAGGAPKPTENPGKT
jgi:diguanylate cyclase (GGDEF)-like protein